MKLIKLTLSNFKGIKHFEFEPNGENASVYGTNASGKTTLFDAFTWLLFDKASTGEPGFSPKTVGPDGKELHNINNRVDGTFRLDNGQLITLSKDQRENWVTKRGSSTEEFAGNTTDYYIDGVPVNKSEYEARISYIFPVDKAQILAQPLFFSKYLDWKSRRAILLDVCGDITDEDVIDSSEELQVLKKYFLSKPGTEEQYYTVDECLKIASAKGKGIRKHLEEIPSRIDEATKALHDDSDIDEDVINGTLSLLRESLDEAIAEKASITEDSATVKFMQQLSEEKARMAESEAKFIREKNRLIDSALNRHTVLCDKQRYIKTKLTGVEGTLHRIEREYESMCSTRESLIDEYRQTEARQWNGADRCLVCGQTLPADRIDKAKAEFNIQKSKDLENIRQRMEKDCSKLMISTHSEAIKEAKNQIATLNEQYEEIKIAANNVTIEIESLEGRKYENTSEGMTFAQEIAQIESKLARSAEFTADLKNTAQAKIDRIRKDMDEVNQKLLILRANEQQYSRISELDVEERKLQKELEDTEYCIFICGEFIKAKVAMLDDKINSKFCHVRFRLFETQINGGIKECCDVMIPSSEGMVPFSSANNAAKLNAGLEIIDTLSSAFGIYLPVFVDNAESVVNLNPIKPQVIRLVVSEADAVLRTEVE